jgi:hypothetical protein
MRGAVVLKDIEGEAKPRTVKYGEVYTKIPGAPAPKRDPVLSEAETLVTDGKNRKKRRIVAVPSAEVAAAVAQARFVSPKPATIPPPAKAEITPDAWLAQGRTLQQKLIAEATERENSLLSKIDDYARDEAARRAAFDAEVERERSAIEKLRLKIAAMEDILTSS